MSAKSLLRGYSQPAHPRPIVARLEARAGARFGRWRRFARIDRGRIAAARFSPRCSLSAKACLASLSAIIDGEQAGHTERNRAEIQAARERPSNAPRDGDGFHHPRRTGHSARFRNYKASPRRLKFSRGSNSSTPTPPPRRAPRRRKSGSAPKGRQHLLQGQVPDWDRRIDAQKSCLPATAMSRAFRQNGFVAGTTFR